MTTEIARFIRNLEEIWDEHVAASLGRRDLAGSLANLVAEPSVLHIPAMIGATGRAALQSAQLGLVQDRGAGRLAGG
jgi:hypothetical protein